MKTATGQWVLTILQRCFRCLPASVGLVLFGGCALNIPYHTQAPLVGNCANPQADICQSSYIQDFGEHTIAIAEFTERGNPFDNNVSSNILDLIRQKSKNNGVAVILFVHGWQHNAQESDSNLIDFKRTIAEIAKKRREFGLLDRELIGLYVGWRGATHKLPLARTLTFWGRKKVAQELGGSGLARLILDIDAIDRTRDDNLLITIGHSFGATAVMRAVSKPLLNRVLDSAPGGISNSCGNTTCGIGDGIYLLNPAIEANHVLSLYENTITRGNYSPQQQPILVSLSSEADFATKYAFPLGQTLGLLATWSQKELDRSYFKNSKTKKTQPLDEQYLDSATMGNFPPYLTHRIDVPPIVKACASALTPEAINLNPCSDYSSAKACGPKHFPRGFDRLPAGSYIDGRPKNYPLFFIRTNSYFMSGHNDIFNPHVIAFLTAQIYERVIAMQEGASSNTLYRDPDYFARQYAKYLEFSCSFLE